MDMGGGDGRFKLRDHVAQKNRQHWPTPVDPTKGGGSSRSGDRINETPTLHGMARKGLFPTPAVQDAENNAGPSQSKRNTAPLNAVAVGSLNPDWVEFFLMGWPHGWTGLNPLISEEIKEYGKKMQLLRKGNGKKKVQRKIGKQFKLHKKKILQPKMHGKRNDVVGTKQISNIKKTETVEKRKMPEMRNHEPIGNSSHRQQLSEQQSYKPYDIMRALSHEMSLGEWEKTTEGTIGLQSLWCACERFGVLSKTLPTLQEIWKSLNNKEKEIVILCSLSGKNWMIDPADIGIIPRTTTIKTNRVQRLKSLGNGQVPQCAAAAWNILAAAAQGKKTSNKQVG